MRYFGIHNGHDAGIAVLDEHGTLNFYAQSERYEPRKKNHSSSLKPILNTFPHLRPTPEDIIVTSHTYGCHLPAYAPYDSTWVCRTNARHQEITKKEIHHATNFVIGHQLAHAFTSWLFRPDDRERFFIAYDGCGENARGNKTYSVTGSISPHGFSIYHEAPVIPSSCYLCNWLGPNSAGKAMGLVGYLSDVKLMMWNEQTINRLLNYMTSATSAFPVYPRIDKPTDDDLHFVASFYSYTIELIWKSLKDTIQQFAQGREIVIGGGTALALELNTRIFNMTQGVVFGPPADDSGIALGCAAFGYFQDHHVWPKITTPSLNALQQPLRAHGCQDPEDIAKRLANDKVIGLLRQRSEAGPRALGFRSLLASAANPDNLRRVSCEIKEREYFRPLAPVVTAEAFDQYFDGPKGEFMQYRVLCKQNTAKELPVIVHRDQSARPQVVYKDKDPWLHFLLCRYGEITGHPVLVNTSLNAKGKPICNTLEDAMEDFEDKDVELVAIPMSAEHTIKMF